MPMFYYVALDSQGQEQQGQLEAADSREATRVLRLQSIYLVSLRQGGAEGDGKGSGVQGGLSVLQLKQYMPVNANDLVFLFRQLALMLNAGHTVVEALEANRAMASKRALNKALEQMASDIQDGDSLSKAVAAQKTVFPPAVSRLLEAGEKSGEIEGILERLADDIERRKEIKLELITALTYPSIVFILALVVTVAMVGWVIPRFAKFLSSRDVALPPVTQFLLDISDWFQDWGGTLGTVLLLVVLGILVAYTTQAGKRAIDWVMLHTPVIGKVILSSGMAQATWTLAMQLRSGITLLSGLRTTREILGNRVLAESFGDAGEKILAGQPLSNALHNTAVPRLVTHMAAIGERSGELDGVMEALGEYYRKDLKGRVKTLAALVEPAMILFVGGIVGVVYLAFFQAALKASAG